MTIKQELEVLIKLSKKWAEEAEKDYKGMGQYWEGYGKAIRTINEFYHNTLTEILEAAKNRGE